MYKILYTSININKIFPPDKLPNRQLFLELEKTGSDFIVCGDLNSKHVLFGNKESSKNGEELVEITSGINALVVQNEIPTYTRVNIPKMC